jgi:hypothetical protein
MNFVAILNGTDQQTKLSANESAKKSENWKMPAFYGIKRALLTNDVRK